MDWKVTERLIAPTDFVQNDSILTWSHPNAERFTLYVYPREMSDEEAINNPLYLKTVVFGNSYDMTGLGDISRLSIAVCSYDRYGVEHDAAIYQGEGCYDFPQVIFWELNGGKVDVELPKYVTETYVLPIPTKEGHQFEGWFKTKTFRGSPLTEIVEGWHGTIYAKWKNISTTIPNVSTHSGTKIYDVMGQYLGTELPTNQHGVFIIIRGNQQTKIVL